MAITSGQDDDPEAGASTAEGYLAYELHAWSRESRVMLQQLLEGASLPYAWEGTDLVAPAVFEEAVDALIEQVEATEAPTLDPDADKVLYELSDWTDRDCTHLAEALGAADIPYEFDLEGSLLVLAADEESVEALLDSIEFPDALAADDGEDDDVDAQVVLSDLFVATDRLQRNARDHEGVLGLVASATAIGRMRLPYGFEPTVWRAIGERAGELRAAIEGDDATDDEIEERAGELRTALRELV